MDIYFNEPNNYYQNNKIKRLNHELYWVPFYSLKKYFFWNYENLYFFLLSLFQLSTLHFLPKEWSPTGPYSTAIPLLICIILEIITDIYVWLKKYYLDYKDNNKKFTILDDNLIKKSIQNKNIYPGHVIVLNKDDVSPIDGILINCKENYCKISLALLTGESQFHFINKITDNIQIPTYKKSLLKIENYFPNELTKLQANLILDDGSNIQVNGLNFVANNSIIKSDEIYLLVTRCGKEKKSFTKQHTNVKIPRLNKHISSYMMNFNVYILIFLIFITSSIKLYYLNTFSVAKLLFFSVQNWILFNGIIPFSIKIFLILIRNIQTIFINFNNKIYINNSLLLDDINKIDRIISDKTGTLTKNDLQFTKILEKNSDEIIDLDDTKEIKLDINFLKCLGLCVHHYEDNFQTDEDRIIRHKYQLFKNCKIFQNNNNVNLDINNSKFSYKYIEINGIDFNFIRKMSSKIVVDNNNEYNIFSKGSINSIYNKLDQNGKKELIRLEKIISDKYPDLRLLACTFKQIKIEDLSDLDNLENNLNLLGIIGIKDNLQEKVPQVIKKFNNLNKFTSICTGDRKITALVIAKEANIIENILNTIDLDEIDISQLDFEQNLSNKTLIFSSAFLEIILKSTNFHLFGKYLVATRNFVAYNLIPEHKKKLVLILEKNNIKTLTIGDGFNDIAMFNVSQISVSITNNQFVKENSDFNIKEFKYIIKLKKLSIDAYLKNSLLTNYTFYRTSFVTFVLFSSILISNNNKNTNESIFNGFVIQGFNFLWTVAPIVFNSLLFDIKKKIKNKDFLNAKIQKFSNNKITTMWILIGIIESMLITYYIFTRFKNFSQIKEILAFIVIFTINFKLIFYIKFNLINWILLMFGPISFIIYNFFLNKDFILLIAILNINFINLLIIMIIWNFVVCFALRHF